MLASAIMFLSISMSLISKILSFFPTAHSKLFVQPTQKKERDTQALTAASKPSTSTNKILDLPEEIVLQILDKLSLQDKVRFRQVSHAANKRANTALWKLSWWDLFITQAELDYFLKSCHTHIRKHGSAAVHMVYETVLAEKAKPCRANIVLDLLIKDKSQRSIEDLIAAKLLDRTQLEGVHLSAEKQDYLCSDQVIVALFQNLQANYKDLEKLPDSLIQNLLKNHHHNVIKEYCSDLLFRSINELEKIEDDALERESVLSRCFTHRKEAVQNPWLMQIYTASWYIPIHLTIIENDVDLLHFFLKHNANTNCKTIHKNCLLSIARQYERHSMIELLLSAQALAAKEAEKAAVRNLEALSAASQMHNTGYCTSYVYQVGA